MPLNNKQTKQLRDILVKILSDKALTPDSLSWQVIEDGINSLTIEEKEKIAKSLAGSGEDISIFIHKKLRNAIEEQVALQVQPILDSGIVTLDFLYSVLL